MPHISLQPARIGRLELRNRLVFPAMVTNFCSQRGEVTDRFIAYHQERAKGGVGLIITEATFIRPDGRSFSHQLGIDEDGLLPGLRRLTAGVHAGGARVAVQLCHAGRQTARSISGLPLLGPSAMTFDREVTRAMTREDINRIVEDYARAAVRARAAGFDAVELHGGNGYLLQQFLSPFTNARTDAYGGSLENRVRFSVEVIRAVRRAVGRDFTVILRLGVEEPIPGGLTLEEGLAAARILASEPIDALDVTAGMREGGMWVTPPLALPQGTHIARAAAVRQAIAAQKPVIGIGRITSVALADRIIESGKADFAVMGRALLADPALPLKTLQGRTEDIRPCIGCNEGCIARLSRGLDISCAVNPRVGNEYRAQPSPAVPAKRIVVVGGGPAGLAAACEAGKRGHIVILLEKEQLCGGNVRLAALPPFKGELEGYADYLERRARSLGVDIRCGTAASAASIVSLRPDAVIVAVGARSATPPIKGLRSCRHIAAETALRQDGTELPKEIVVIGGGLVGCETALHLAKSGKKVQVVEMRDAVCLDVEPRSRAVMLRHLEEYDVCCTTSARVAEITGDDILIDTRQEGSLSIRHGGTIVLATGYIPDRQLIADLEKLGMRPRAIGDCADGGRILDAVWQGTAAVDGL